MFKCSRNFQPLHSVCLSLSMGEKYYISLFLNESRKRKKIDDSNLFLLRHVPSSAHGMWRDRRTVWAHTTHKNNHQTSNLTQIFNFQLLIDCSNNQTQSEAWTTTKNMIFFLLYKKDSFIRLSIQYCGWIRSSLLVYNAQEDGEQRPRRRRSVEDDDHVCDGNFIIKNSPMLIPYLFFVEC